MTISAADSGGPNEDKAASARPVKHSFSIAGHRTSISLEAAFWEALRSAAARERLSLAALVQLIDKGRGGAGLSSAIRVWLLDDLKRRVETRPSMPPAGDGN